MKEELLHYAWRMRRFNATALQTTDGQVVEILHPGQLNTHAGPDFLNARLRIDDTVWAGNVEMHLRSSDWLQHGHQSDAAYDNVILHVVYEDDAPICRGNGTAIPCLELKQRISRRLAAHYQRLIKSEQWVPCGNTIGQVNELTINLWLDRMAAERLEARAEKIKAQLLRNKEGWEETFYQFMARSLGGRVNAEPMQMLAERTPLILLYKYRHSLFQLEALLFGQSGLLDASFVDEYPKRLQQEYRFLRQKHGLTPLPPQTWKYLRLRPANFPTIRIAQLVTMIYQQAGWFSKAMAAHDLTELNNMFHIKLSNYWWDHYTFDKPSHRQAKTLGVQTIRSVIINTVAPMLFLYGSRKGDHVLRDKGLDLLEKLPAEQNKIIREWKKHGVKADSAYQTQALLQLKQAYCTPKRCLECAIGNALLKPKPRAEEPWLNEAIGEDWEKDWSLFDLEAHQAFSHTLQPSVQLVQMSI
ncbi:MAG: DUF2851 family protein [Phaeodactylibacter sp.]|uniref:DUF2851 family protein n=1 Tax=Phaeodactylibacter sp. TaxID=1940289 RepID=UPI0032ED1F5B